MSDLPVVAAERLAELNDQHWRRLGITQTFDRLLVEAAATTPGNPEHVRDAVSRGLSGGAEKFWELSFPGLVKDLARRGVVTRGEAVHLEADFHERLSRMLDDLAEGASHVEPTPGVTLEDVLEKAKRREEAAKAVRPKRPRAPAAPRSASEPKKASAATPRKRTPAADEAPPPRAAAAPARRAPAAAPRTPSSKLFTSLKLNRLLDSLDNAQLLRSQLARRVDLSGEDLERFLTVTAALEITRVDGQMVELHWKGRELARTSNVDRRMVLIDLVRDLRARADDEDV
ncbi:MAG: hypothetical protein H6702_00915 [Myxococcales bacterium]|nr:hypothetical protein [Myxococcales bacterium]